MAMAVPWFPESESLALGRGELHVWHGSLNLPEALHCDLEARLTPEEQQRAAKFLTSQAREHFVAARGILRQLLGAYLGIRAEEVAFRYGPHGKPSLARGHDSRICFNASHSGGMGMLVFAEEREVGADLEQMRADAGGMEIAARFFSQEEKAELAKLPPELRNEAFFRCWTRKEAYVKARGEGMGIPLESFTVRFADDREQQMVDETGRRWSCYGIELPRGFTGAVVAAGQGWRLRQREWCPGEKARAVARDGS